MEFRCDCGRKLRAPDTAAGRRGRCPACGAIFTVPTAAQAPVTEPQPVPAATVGPHPSPFDPPGERLPFDEQDPQSDNGEIPLAQPAHPAVSSRSSTTIFVPPAPASVAAAAVTGRPRATTYADRAPRPVQPLEQGDTGRSYLYLVLLVVLLPLLWSTIHKTADDSRESLKDRFMHTIEKHPEVMQKMEELPDDPSDAQVFAVLPGHKLDGALLPKDTMLHWAFAMLSAVLFIAAVLLLFPHGHAKIPSLIGTGVFTGTFGILLLLGFQWLAFHIRLVIPRGLFGMLWDVVALIGLSYRLALTDTGFFLSALGFTAGVGFCEEVCKAIPIIAQARGSGFTTWRSAMLVGLISGVGFGVSEGITYSSDYYNGIAGAEMYWVRFVSCVGLHAIWAASVGITIFQQQDIFRGELHPLQWLSNLLQVVVVPMLLHGFYDTLLKQKYELYALLVAFASFGWLAFQIERAKRKFDDTGLGAAMAGRRA